MSVKITPRSYCVEERRSIRLIKTLDEMIDCFADIGAKPRFAAGEKEVLPLVLTLYFRRNRIPPRWAREAFAKAFNTGGKNWDDLIGKHPHRKKGLVEKQRVAYQEAQKILQQSAKISDDDLFPKLGASLKIRAGTAKEHYYAKAKQERNETNRLTKVAEWMDVPKEDAAVRIMSEMIRMCQRLNIDFVSVMKCLHEKPVALTWDPPFPVHGIGSKVGRLLKNQPKNHKK
jgi:hypothetical protein